jgi:hypothetical protein
MSPLTLFGAPTRLDSATQQWWIRLLTKNWMALMGRPPHLLEADLDHMAPLFANGASPKNVKARIYALPEADAETKLLPREVVLIIDGCALVTPEGRILLDVLLDMQHAGGEEIDVNRQLSALATATALRSEWHARWLHNQFESSISAPVLGAALFLLINGSVGESRALLLPSDSERDRELGTVVMPLIAGFSKSLGGNEPVADGGIRQHWAFTQLSRLLGRDVAREKTKHGTATFVRIGRERNLLDELASRLERTADAHRRYSAIADFTDGYRRARGPLAALGQMHEDPTTTRRITDRLLAPGGIL